MAVRPDTGDKWRRGRDSNPRYGVTVHLLSKQAPSTARPPLRRKTTLSHPELCAPAALPAPREGGMASGLPGPRPSGVLRTARFAPGESVEPAVRGYRTLAFQASAFDRSATSEVAKPHCLIRNFALRLPFPLRVRAGWPRAFLALALRASFGRPDSLPATPWKAANSTGRPGDRQGGRPDCAIRDHQTAYAGSSPGHPRASRALQRSGAPCPPGAEFATGKLRLRGLLSRQRNRRCAPPMNL